MTSRIVLSLLTLCLIIFVLGLKSYQKIFNNDKRITTQRITQLDPKLIPPKVEEKKEEVKKEVSFKVALDTPELERAHQIYTQEGQCLQCHGQFGEGNPSEEAPIIGGQHSWYVEAQLNAFKSKKRVNKKMEPYIANLSAEDFKILAKYIEKMRVPKKAN